LNGLPGAFGSLVASMQEQKKWAYQEGIVDLLTEDVKRGTFKPDPSLRMTNQDCHSKRKAAS
jgi:hypothetical protein